MGRDIDWYVLPKKLIHENTKQLCFELEFVPEYEEYEEYKKQFVPLTNVSTSSAIYDKEVDRLCCSKCALYLFGIYRSSLVKDSTRIQHSYLDKISNSKWCIANKVYGSYTDFTKRFEGDYTEVGVADFEELNRVLKNLGEPIRKVDKEALKETLTVVEFLEKWVGNSDVRVIMSNDS